MQNVETKVVTVESKIVKLQEDDAKKFAEGIDSIDILSNGRDYGMDPDLVEKHFPFAVVNASLPHGDAKTIIYERLVIPLWREVQTLRDDLESLKHATNKIIELLQKVSEENQG